MVLDMQKQPQHIGEMEHISIKGEYTCTCPARTLESALVQSSPSLLEQ